MDPSFATRHRKVERRAVGRRRADGIAAVLAPLPACAAESLSFEQQGMGGAGMSGMYPGAEAHGIMGPGYGEHSMMSVNGPVRPWGKRSKEHPLTRHTPSSFQRAGQGHGGSMPR